MRGKCKLCELDKDLMKSHAIPDAFFRRLFESNSGKSISLTTDNDQDVCTSSESSWTYQLCNECEIKLNEKYESYSINLLRGVYGNSSRKKNGIEFLEVDVDKLIKFFLTIFWRAVVSEHQHYRGAAMNIALFKNNRHDLLRQCLLNDSKIPEKFFSVKIRRLCDSRGYFDLKSLKSLITYPFNYRYKNSCKTSVGFVIEGFYISVVMPALSDKERRRDMVLYSKGTQFLAEFVDISSIPELVALNQGTLKKVGEGRSSIS